MPDDYYGILGVDRNTSARVIQRAFRRLALLYHPDLNRDAGAEDTFKKINEAYQTLSDPQLREAYNRFWDSSPYAEHARGEQQGQNSRAEPDDASARSSQAGRASRAEQGGPSHGGGQGRGGAQAGSGEQSGRDDSRRPLAWIIVLAVLGLFAVVIASNSDDNPLPNQPNSIGSVSTPQRFASVPASTPTSRPRPSPTPRPTLPPTPMRRPLATATPRSGSPTPTLIPIPIPRPPQSERFTSVSSGFLHACALRDDGSPVCWGYDRYGQATLPAGERLTALSSGIAHTCALREDGSPVCWGDTLFGGATPPLNESFIALSSGANHTCALREDGSPVCWGYEEGIDSPPPGERFAALSGGGGHTCALREDGSPVCWGYDSYGQATPPPGERFMALSSGYSHTCALREDGSPVCWGLDDYGKATPPTGDRFMAISSGNDHTCALREDGSPVCWGLDDAGQAKPPIGESVHGLEQRLCLTRARCERTARTSAGDGTYSARPRRHNACFTALSRGGSHTCALRENGTPACWGYERFGHATPPLD